MKSWLNSKINNELNVEDDKGTYNQEHEWDAVASHGELFEVHEKA